LKFVFEIASGGHPVRETARRARTAVTYARDDAVHVWPLPPANFRNIGQCTSLWQRLRILSTKQCISWYAQMWTRSWHAS